MKGRESQDVGTMNKASLQPIFYAEHDGDSFGIMESSNRLQSDCWYHYYNMILQAVLVKPQD